MKKAIVFLLILAAIVLLFMWKPDYINKAEKPIESAQQQNADTKALAAKEAFVQSFEYLPIDSETEKRIKGISWRQNDNIKLEELSYVKVTYWGFDEMPHIGELIVNKNVSMEIIEIFKELYAAKFPIEKIKLVDEYNAQDSLSMDDNNTSAFCYREIADKPGKLSMHSYGLAIDINPVQNPYVFKENVEPEAGREYTDRSKLSKGMIVKNDAVYNAFTSRGWTWGGDWKNQKDYQHFEK